MKFFHFVFEILFLLPIRFIYFFKPLEILTNRLFYNYVVIFIEGWKRRKVETNRRHIE